MAIKEITLGQVSGKMTKKGLLHLIYTLTLKGFCPHLQNLNHNKFYPKLAKIQIHKIFQFLKKNKYLPLKTKSRPESEKPEKELKGNSKLL